MGYLVVLFVVLVVWQLFMPRSTFREVLADIRRRRRSSREVAEKMEQLHALTEPERAVLRAYVLVPAYERIQDPQDAVIRRLIERGILRPVQGLQSDGDGFSFSVAAWTRSYLVSRPELLN